MDIRKLPIFFYNNGGRWILVAITIFMLGVMPSVYAHTEDYLKGYKLGKEDGKTGSGGYGSIECF